MVLSFCQRCHLTWQNLAKLFRWDIQVGNFAQMKASVELCINKHSDAAAESELQANSEKTSSCLGLSS